MIHHQKERETLHDGKKRSSKSVHKPKEGYFSPSQERVDHRRDLSVKSHFTEINQNGIEKRIGRPKTPSPSNTNSNSNQKWPINLTNQQFSSYYDSRINWDKDPSFTRETKARFIPPDVNKLAEEYENFIFNSAKKSSSKEKSLQSEFETTFGRSRPLAASNVYFNEIILNKKPDSPEARKTTEENIPKTDKEGLSIMCT